VLSLEELELNKYLEGIRSRRQTPLSAPSLVFIPPRSAYAANAGFFFNSFVGFYTHHSFSVTFCPLGFRPFYSAETNIPQSWKNIEYITCVMDFIMTGRTTPPPTGHEQ
jgi:hypothetical protein